MRKLLSSSSGSGLRTVFRWIVFFAGLAVLAACGGGGGGDGSSAAESASTNNQRGIQPEVLIATGNPNAPLAGYFSEGAALVGVNLDNGGTGAVFSTRGGEMLVLVSDANGDPAGAMAGGYTYYFQNYNGRSADVLVVAPDGTQQLVEDVDISSALERTAPTGAQQARILDDVRGFANFLSGAACLVGLSSIGVASGGAAVPAIVPFATIVGCGNFILQNSLVQSADQATLSDEAVASFSTFTGTAACAMGDVGSCVGAAADGADIIAEGVQNMVASPPSINAPLPEDDEIPVSDEFACDDGFLIPAIQVCNGTANCRDGSDENSELCGTDSTCCVATAGCPSETALDCDGTCCCCPFGQACSQANFELGCVAARGVAVDPEESLVSKLLFKGSYY